MVCNTMYSLSRLQVMWSCDSRMWNDEALILWFSIEFQQVVPGSISSNESGRRSKYFHLASPVSVFLLPAGIKKTVMKAEAASALLS